MGWAMWGVWGRWVMLMLGEVVVAVDMAGGSFRVCRGHTWPAYGTGGKGRTACAPTPGNARAGEMPAGQYSPWEQCRKWRREAKWAGTARWGHEFWAEGAIAQITWYHNTTLRGRNQRLHP